MLVEILLKKSVFAAAAMSVIPAFVIGKEGKITSVNDQLSRALGRTGWD
jgi:hypothetical protein